MSQQAIPLTSLDRQLASIEQAITERRDAEIIQLPLWPEPKRGTALKQKAEAELAEWQAINQTEIATNAARKQRADARKAAADAQKSQAEAITAREVAKNSDLKARAEAEAQQAEVELKTQQTLIEIEVAKQAARRQKLEADVATEESLSAGYANMVIQRNLR